MRFLPFLLALVVSACLCGTALGATQDFRNPDNRAAVTVQDLRNADNRAPEHAGQVVAAGVAGATTTDGPIVPTAPSDGGLSAFAIVLISLGGAAAIGGLAYAATRMVHHHPHGLA